MSATTCARSGGAALFAATHTSGAAFDLLEHQRDADRQFVSWRLKQAVEQTDERNKARQLHEGFERCRFTL